MTLIMGVWLFLGGGNIGRDGWTLRNDSYIHLHVELRSPLRNRSQCDIMEIENRYSINGGFPYDQTDSRCIRWE